MPNVKFEVTLDKYKYKVIAKQHPKSDYDFIIYIYRIKIGKTINSPDKSMYINKTIRTYNFRVANKQNVDAKLLAIIVRKTEYERLIENFLPSTEATMDKFIRHKLLGSPDILTDNLFYDFREILKERFIDIIRNNKSSNLTTNVINSIITIELYNRLLFAFANLKPITYIINKGNS